MSNQIDQIQKKVAHDLDSSVDCFKIPCNNAWHFAELMCDTMEIDFFEKAQNCDIFEYEDVLSWCITVLDQSPSAKIMLTEAVDQGWVLALDDIGGCDYSIDAILKTVTLDNNAVAPSALGRSKFFRNTTLVTLIRALRDIWQEKRHGGFDELYSPEHVILLERIRAADLDVMAVLCAWELRAADYSDVWRHIIGTEIGDIAMAYLGYLERDPTAQYNGFALFSAFKQWFQKEDRISSCDRDTLDYLDDVLMSCGPESFGYKKPGKINIEMLSSLPDKSAYLQGQGSEILSDPIYASIENDINKAHLTHIIYDTEAVMVENVPFRDADLAQKIFPEEE